MFGVAAGWPSAQADQAAEIIVLHMRDDVATADDPETHLLQVATAWDVVGRRPCGVLAEVRTEVLASYPPRRVRCRFTECFRDQAEQAVSAAAASLANDGAADRRQPPRFLGSVARRRFFAHHDANKVACRDPEIKEEKNRENLPANIEQQIAQVDRQKSLIIGISSRIGGAVVRLPGASGRCICP